MKGSLGIVAVILAALTVAPASAGTLYKCVGSDGVANYVSKRIGGSQCSRVGSYRATPVATRSTPAAALPPVPATSPASTPATASAPVAGAAAASRSATSPATAGKAQRVVSGQVYSYMKDGVRHYTSSRPQQVANVGPVRTIQYSYIERCYACGVNSGINFGKVRLNTHAYNAEIAAAAREFGVEEAVVRAIIHAESAFNPTALSRAGAQGLMQLMPATARRFGVSDSYDAGQNIRGGVQYLSWLLRRFNGNLTLAAAGYNAGEGAVDRHGGVPPYRETQHYVQRVAQLADRYRGEMATRQ